MACADGDDGESGRLCLDDDVVDDDDDEDAGRIVTDSTDVRALMCSDLVGSGSRMAERPVSTSRGAVSRLPVVATGTAALARLR